MPNTISETNSLRCLDEAKSPATYVTLSVSGSTLPAAPSNLASSSELSLEDCWWIQRPSTQRCIWSTACLTLVPMSNHGLATPSQSRWQSTPVKSAVLRTTEHPSFPSSNGNSHNPGAVASVSIASADWSLYDHSIRRRLTGLCKVQAAEYLRNS
jgi:hypothetical protein